MKKYPAATLIKIVLMMVLSSALTTSCLNSDQKNNDVKSILVSGRIQLPKNYPPGIHYKHVLGNYVTYTNQDMAKQSTVFKVDENGEFSFKVHNNSKIFLEVFYHDYFQSNVLKYYGEIKVPVNGGAISPIILEATPQSVKKAYDIAGSLQFPKEYQGKIDTSNIAIYLSILPHKNTNTYMAKADGSFKLGTCLTGPGRISINHYDPQSQKIFYGSIEFSKVTGKDLQTGPIKLQVKTPEIFQKPISISGKFELPEGYRDEICPSQIEVTFINCPTFKRQTIMLQKDGTFQFQSNYPGDARIMAYSYVSGCVIEGYTDIYTRENLKLQPILLDVSKDKRYLLTPQEQLKPKI